MARPSAKSGDKHVQERLQEAFFTLLARYPIDEISVSMIVAEAKCARGSFYYHFESYDIFIEKMIYQTFPSEIPGIMADYFFLSKGDISETILDPALQAKIDRCCLLVGPHSSLSIIDKCKGFFLSAWCSTLGFSLADLPIEAQIIFEFVGNGLIGMMSFRAKSNMTLKLTDCFGALFPDIPEAFMRRMGTLMEPSPHLS